LYKIVVACYMWGGGGVRLCLGWGGSCSLLLKKKQNKGRSSGITFGLEENPNWVSAPTFPFTIEGIPTRIDSGAFSDHLEPHHHGDKAILGSRRGTEPMRRTAPPPPLGNSRQKGDAKKWIWCGHDAEQVHIACLRTKHSLKKGGNVRMLPYPRTRPGVVEHHATYSGNRVTESDPFRPLKYTDPKG